MRRPATFCTAGGRSHRALHGNGGVLAADEGQRCCSSETRVSTLGRAQACGRAELEENVLDGCTAESAPDESRMSCSGSAPAATGAVGAQGESCCWRV